MKHIRWKLTEGERCVDVGTVVAESDREAIAQVMEDKADLVGADGFYKIVAGDAAVSVHGDEFGTIAHLVRQKSEFEDTTGIDGYLFGTTKPEPTIQEYGDKWIGLGCTRSAKGFHNWTPYGEVEECTLCGKRRNRKMKQDA